MAVKGDGEANRPEIVQAVAVKGLRIWSLYTSHEGGWGGDEASGSGNANSSGLTDSP